MVAWRPLLKGNHSNKDLSTAFLILTEETIIFTSVEDNDEASIDWAPYMECVEQDSNDGNTEVCSDSSLMIATHTFWSSKGHTNIGDSQV